MTASARLRQARTGVRERALSHCVVLLHELERNRITDLRRNIRGTENQFVGAANNDFVVGGHHSSR